MYPKFRKTLDEQNYISGKNLLGGFIAALIYLLPTDIWCIIASKIPFVNNYDIIEIGLWVHCLLPFAIMMCFFGGYLVKSLAAFFKKRFFLSVIVAVAAYIASIIMRMPGGMLITFFGNDNMNQSTTETIVSTYNLYAIVFVVFLAPIIEEIIFRGCIFNPIAKKSFFLAYLVSSFLFAFVHIAVSVLLLGNVDELINLTIYMPIGLAIAFCYHYTGNIWTAILMHMINNGVSVLLLLSM